MGESTPTEVEIGTPTYRSGSLGIDQETKNELITLGTKLGELQMETAHLRVVK